MLLRSVSPYLLSDASFLSKLFFGTTKFASKLLDLIPATAIHRICELPSEAEIISALEQYCEPQETISAGAVTLAAILGGVTAVALATQTRTTTVEVP